MTFIPENPKTYQGNQVIINSDRLVFNAKNDAILLYSDWVGSILITFSISEIHFFQSLSILEILILLIASLNFVTVSTTDDQENEFDFGSGDLFDYVVAQHAAGAKCAFWHFTQLELDAASGGDPPTGANTNQFNWSTDSNPPILKVTFTLPPVFNTKLKISSGTTKVLGGNLTIK